MAAKNKLTKEQKIKIKIAEVALIQKVTALNKAREDIALRRAALKRLRQGL